jgi:hypothetical protein
MEIDEELFSAESAIVLAHWKWRQSGSEEKAAKQGVTDAKRAKSRLLSDRQAAEEMAFKNRMMEKYGMVGHKKAEKVWEMAWDEGW